MNTKVNLNDSYERLVYYDNGKESKKYIDDVFNALYMTWQYMPDDNQWDEYIKSIKKNYYRS